MRYEFSYKSEVGMQECNGNGGSTYTSSYTYYDLYVNGEKTQSFDSVGQLYEHVNKTYFPKSYSRAKARIAKLRAVAKAKEDLAYKADEELRSSILGKNK